MHGGREELVPKYQISPVTHPVSARAPCVHYHYEACLLTLDIRDTRQWEESQVSPGVSSRPPYSFTALYCGTGHQRSCSEQLWHAENGAGAGPPVYGEHVTVVSVVTGDHPGQGKKRKFVWVRAQGAAGVKLVPYLFPELATFLFHFITTPLSKYQVEQYRAILVSVH